MIEEQPRGQGILISYKVPLFTRFLSFVSSVFRLMSLNLDHIPSEFKQLNNQIRLVDSYRALLCLLYAKPGEAPPKDRWRVTAIQTYKDTRTTVLHEYLVATLHDGEERSVMVRIERAKRRITSEDDSSDDTDSKFKKAAVDSITLVSHSPPIEDDQLQVDHIEFSKGITLSQLVILACSINDYARDYDFFKKNCYWFCYVAIEMLRKQFDDHHSPGLADRSWQGTWHNVPATALFKKIEWPELLAKYNRMMKEFDDEVSMSLYDGKEYANFVLTD